MNIKEIQDSNGSVKIFTDPLTEEDQEGQAILHKFIGREEVRGYGNEAVENWEVKFVGEEDDPIVVRSILIGGKNWPTDEELIQFYRNAYTTGCMAGGHTKGERNLAQAKKYRAELEERGVTIPKGTGRFNGPGSW